MLIATVTFELDNNEATYYRKSIAVWDLLGFIGGFTVSLIYFAK